MNEECISSESWLRHCPNCGFTLVGLSGNMRIGSLGRLFIPFPTLGGDCDECDGSVLIGFTEDDIVLILDEWI